MSLFQGLIARRESDIRSTNPLEEVFRAKYERLVALGLIIVLPQLKSEPEIVLPVLDDQFAELTWDFIVRELNSIPRGKQESQVLFDVFLSTKGFFTDSVTIRNKVFESRFDLRYFNNVTTGLKADIHFFVTRLNDTYKLGLSHAYIERQVTSIHQALGTPPDEALITPTRTTFEPRKLWKNRTPVVSAQDPEPEFTPPTFIQKYYKDVIEEHGGAVPQTVVRGLDPSLWVAMQRYIEKYGADDLGFTYVKKSDLVEARVHDLRGDEGVTQLHADRERRRRLKKQPESKSVDN